MHLESGYWQAHVMALSLAEKGLSLEEANALIAEIDDPGLRAETVKITRDLIGNAEDRWEAGGPTDGREEQILARCYLRAGGTSDEVMLYAFLDGMNIKNKKLRDRTEEIIMEHLAESASNLPEEETPIGEPEESLKH